MISRITSCMPITVSNIAKKQNVLTQYNLKQDTVSFSGKKPVQTTFSPTVEKALSVQSKLNKLYRSNNLSLETIEEVLNKQSPVPIEIIDMKQIPEAFTNAKNCQAYMQPLYENDLKMKGAKIYIKSDFEDKKTASGVIADVIHEFTHILQRDRDNDYLGLSKFTSNLDEARFLNYIAANTMRDMERTMFNNLNTKTEFLDIVSKKSKHSIPLDKNDVKPFLGSKEELTDTLNRLLNLHFQNTIDKFQIPSKYAGEYNFFYNKAKPTLEKSVIKRFEMESEAKSADMEARKRGLVCDYRSIFGNSINKSLYDAFLEIMK